LNFKHKLNIIIRPTLQPLLTFFFNIYISFIAESVEYLTVLPRYFAEKDVGFLVKIDNVFNVFVQNLIFERNSSIINIIDL